MTQADHYDGPVPPPPGWDDDTPTLELPDGTEAEHSGWHRGQVRFAYLLARYYSDQLLHVHGIGWHTWDGRRWVEDTKGAAKRAVLELLRAGWKKAFTDKEWEQDVRRCETAAGIAGILSIASALETFAATVDDLDADPCLLNCANGTLDLRTRELRPHDPADRLTKVTAGAYDPSADPGVWQGFLATVLPDDEERAYLRRVVGQALYGRVTEHVLPILIGTGANGKSTTYGALNFAVGDYGVVVDPSMLMVKPHGGGATTELMDLLGARLVFAAETEQGRKLDEALMKRLTGGDPITARRLYRDPVTWTPSHTLVYVTNHLPKVAGGDPAVWRRVRVVPFDVIVPEDQQDRDLPARLELHADAILSWAVHGYFDYADNGGMREPSTVLRATDAYQVESDDVRRFINEACTLSPAAHATTGELYEAWQLWARDEGVEPLTLKAFAGELDRLGYPAGKRTKRGVLRLGLMPPKTTDGEGW